MAMGKRRRHATQTAMWVATQDLSRGAAHPFYTRLNQILDKHDFDSYVEGLCQRFYAEEIGRPSLFRVGRISLVIGIACLAVSLLLGDVIAKMLHGGRLGEMLRESLLIGGWVAM